MGAAFFGFLVGYAVGTRSGRAGAQEVLDALRSLRESEEFRGLVEALRDHAGQAAHSLGDWLGGESDGPTLDDIIRDARERLTRQ